MVAAEAVATVGIGICVWQGRVSVRRLARSMGVATMGAEGVVEPAMAPVHVP